MTSRIIRLFVEDDLQDAATIELDQRRSHYVVNVMRSRKGDPLRLFNGRQGEWLAKMVALDRRQAIFQVEKQIRAQETELGPVLAFALIKRQRLEMLIEKTVELGVGHLVPLITQNTVADRMNVNRTEAIIIEAAEQSERLTLPTIAEVESLETWLAARSTNVTLIVADETANDPHVADLLEEHPDAMLLIGPEGGFSDIDRQLIASHDSAKTASLGPRVLRAETAAMVMVNLWQELGGGLSQN
ncbi:MAG: 16S rRNA (uracil(1498)-N(3))-methyltransferase [Geminicoccaceae bacterium]